jgi:hypothetical protein
LKVVEWPVDPNFEAESTMLTCGKLEIEKWTEMLEISGLLSEDVAERLSTKALEWPLLGRTS